jgi:tetratricopeptide (TPR) repeat protein
VYRFPLLRNAAKINFMDNPLVAASLQERLCTALKILGDYILAMFWPLRLAPDYSFNQVPVSSSIHLLAVVLVVIALALAVWSYRKGGVAWFGLIFFFIMIAPVSNVMTIIGTIKADRFLYLPSLGFCIAAGALFSRARPLALALAGVVFLACGAQTVARNHIWKTEINLWQDATASAPQSAKGHYNLGYQQLLAGRNADAAGSFEKAVAIYPDFALARLNLGVALIYSGAPDRALKLYNESQPMFVTNADFYVNRGLAYAYMGQREAAAGEFRHALELNPHLEDARHNLEILGAGAFSR